MVQNAIPLRLAYRSWLGSRPVLRYISTLKPALRNWVASRNELGSNSGEKTVTRTWVSEPWRPLPSTLVSKRSTMRSNPRLIPTAGASCPENAPISRSYRPPAPIEPMPSSRSTASNIGPV